MAVADPPHFDPVTRSDLETLRADIRADLAGLRGDLRTEMADRERRLVLWAVGVALAAVGVGVAAVGLLLRLFG